MEGPEPSPCARRGHVSGLSAQTVPGLGGRSRLRGAGVGGGGAGKGGGRGGLVGWGLEAEPASRPPNFRSCPNSGSAGWPQGEEVLNYNPLFSPYMEGKISGFLERSESLPRGAF